MKKNSKVREKVSKLSFNNIYKEFNEKACKLSKEALRLQTRILLEHEFMENLSYLESVQSLY